MIRDVPVKVPEPEDFIAEYIFPSHIVVPRCSGQNFINSCKNVLHDTHSKQETIIQRPKVKMMHLNYFRTFANIFD